MFPTVLGDPVKSHLNPQSDHDPQAENHWPKQLEYTDQRVRLIF